MDANSKPNVQALSLSSPLHSNHGLSLSSSPTVEKANMYIKESTALFHH